eukprot:snap_masked-scaffold_8-processed-gene-11.4-mRNA-1 protein AED:1.00 eAED:1.00 QI:0/-1/0/0/-1/1/1/0/466
MQSIKPLATKISSTFGSYVSFPSSNTFKRIKNNFKITVSECSSEYAAVLSAFQENFRKNKEKAAQISIFCRNKRVLNISGISEDFKPENFNTNSLNVIHSSGKVIESLILAYVLQNQKQEKKYSYDSKISAVWPEFAVNGKENITITDLMKHDGGLPYFESIQRRIRNKYLGDEKEFSKELAEQKPIWLHKNTAYLKEKCRIYHAQTRGFYLNEIIKRIDEKKRSLGRIFEEEIVPELENQNIIIGIRSLSPDRKYLEKQIYNSKFFYLYQDIKKIIDHKRGKRDPNGKDLPSFLMSQNNSTVSFMQFNAVASTYYYPFMFNIDNFQHEASSYNILSSADCLSSIIQKFIFEKNKILSDKSIKDLLSLDDESRKFDYVMGYETIFTKGGLCLFESHDDKSKPQRYLDEVDGFYGWGGYGGSALIFDMEKKLVISYVPAGLRLLSAFGVSDERFINLLPGIVKASHI